MLRVGVIGSTGYSGQELVKTLLKNPGVKITYLTARLENEPLYSDVYPQFAKKISLRCRNFNVEEAADSCDLIFLALPHTVSMETAPLLLEKGKKVIDLSGDYRLPPDTYQLWY
ncbi:MAG: NAD(P)-binding domain-containing protein, partial [Candidatus Omnitrophota bacterium]